MFRFQGVSATIREAAGPTVTDAFALLTELGGVPFLIVALAVLYWIDDRESTATVIGYTLVALALTLLLKEWLTIPRPPPAVRAVAVESGSHGFPSGHAIAAIVVYGSLLLVRGGLRNPRAALPTATLIGLIGLSRVVIGVHYLGDVLAGFAVGAAVVAALHFTIRDRPHLACAIAAVCSLLAVLVTGSATYALVILGGSLGGIVAFGTVDVGSLPRPDGLVQSVGLVAVGLAVVGALFALSTAVPVAPIAVLGSAVLVGVVVVLPRVLSLDPVAKWA